MIPMDLFVWGIYAVIAGIGAGFTCVLLGVYNDDWIDIGMIVWFIATPATLTFLWGAALLLAIINFLG